MSVCVWNLYLNISNLGAASTCCCFGFFDTKKLFTLLGYTLNPGLYVAVSSDHFLEWFLWIACSLWRGINEMRYRQPVGCIFGSWGSSSSWGRYCPPIPRELFYTASYFLGLQGLLQVKAQVILCCVNWKKGKEVEGWKIAVIGEGLDIVTSFILLGYPCPLIFVLLYWMHGY